MEEGEQIRVIIQFYYDFLRKKTAAVDLDNDNVDTSVLLKAISKKVDKPLHEIVATVKKDNIPVRIIAGWPLSFYEIKDRVVVNVEFKDGESEESNQRKKASAMNNRYLKKLGINKEDRALSIIKDSEEEGDDENDQSSFRKSNENGAKTSWKNNSQRSASSSDDEDTVPKNVDLRKMLENYLETLNQETKNNRTEEVKKLLVEIPQRIAPSQITELKAERQKIINELAKDGFNPLHHAVYQNNPQIVQELLAHNANVNVPNQQGWTSLQMAIHKNNVQIVKLLLESPTLDMQYVSQVGTALTVACQFSKPQIISLLLEKNPTFDLEPYMELCKSDDCKVILKAYIKGIQDKKQNLAQQERISPKGESNVVIFQEIPLLPPRPPIVRGVFYKISNLLYSLRERYFVLNPDEGTLIRYKSISHYPLKPLEVIPLKDMTHIQEIDKSWFMSSDYSYFEINFPTRQVLACRHPQAVKKWIEYIFMASVYSYYTESRNQVNVSQIKENQVVQLTDSPNQLPIEGNIGGNVKDAVKSFILQKKSAEAAQEKRQNNENSKTDEQNQALEQRGQSLRLNAQQQQGQQLAPSKALPQHSPSRSNGQVSNQQKQSQEQIKSSKTLKSPEKEQSPPKSPGPSNINKQQTMNDKDSKKHEGEDNIPHDERNPDLSDITDEKVTFESFQMMKVLGAGSFGKVFFAKKKDTQQIYAIKALKKRPLIMKRQLRYAVTEANVLKMCSHPFVLGLHFAFQTPSYLYLVLDYCSGGDISSHLANKKRFKEEEAVFYIAELVLAIQHIHEKDVVYRDLKPENILIANDGHIKLADFGLSKDNVSDTAKTKSFCGTPAYLSPEMLNNKGATKASDLYGIGAVLFEMLTGDPPYYNDDIPTMYKKIKEGNLSYPSYVSTKARNIINGLLDRNPKTRLGSIDKEQLKRDPFFEKIDWQKLYNKEYTPPITEFENDDGDEDFEEPAENNVFNDFDYQQHNKNTNRVKNFSFIRK